MNDFYTPRRAIIADTSGLIGMAIAGVASSALVWETLATGFRTGRLEKAFLVFLAVVLGASAVGGMIGLNVGRMLAAKWEKRHRGRRPTVYSDERAATGGTSATARGNANPAPASGMHVQLASAVASDAVALAEGSAVPSAPRLLSLLCHIDGQLAGVLQLAATEGAGSVLRLEVAPQFRRQGAASALVRAARERCPAGLSFPPSTDTGAQAFLKAVGAQQSAAWSV